MLALAKRLVKEEEGQGLVEYALIIALIAVAVIAAIALLGDKVEETFNDINQELTDQDVGPAE